MVDVGRPLRLGCALGFIYLVGVATPPAAWSEGTQPVVWTHAVNVTITGNSIEKTGGCDGCDDAGAVSAQQITSGDGYVEFTVPLTTKTVFAGLGTGDLNTLRADIDFGLKFYQGGIAEVRENNLWQAETTFAANDVFRVAVVGGRVTYSRNGTVFYTSVKPPIYPLLLDTSLQDLNAVVSNAVISQPPAPAAAAAPAATSQLVAWTSALNVTVTAGSVEKTGGCDSCDDAGAVSAQQITQGDGYVEFMIPLVTKTVFAGLGTGDLNTLRADIDFGLKFNPGGTQNVAWKDPVNVTVTGNSIEKTGGCDGCDDAGAVSDQEITQGDGYVEFTIPLTTKTVSAGLSHDDTDTLPGDIDFGLKFIPGGVVEVRENNVWQAQTTFSANDVFRVAVVVGRVHYSRNGVVFYTSAKVPGYPLLLDTSLADLNAKIVNAMISGALSFGVVEVRENDLWQAQTLFEEGDVFRVAVVGGRVRYSKNGVVFHVSAKPPLYPLLVDTTFSDLNGIIVNAVISGVLSGATPCPVPAALGAIPGSTEFNNTVRAQMWIDGHTWWAAFSDASSGIYFYRLDGTTWVKGDRIDGNFKVGEPDTLWNGADLFVLVYQSGSLARLYKYRPSGTGYALVEGFPVDLPLAGLASAIALHQDSLGKLWATYTSGRNVHVIWSTSSDHRTWDTTGFVLASGVDDTTTEAATLAPFGPGMLGVVWGNQALGEIAFSFHRDGDPETTWSAKEIVDCCQGIGGVADDHLSLRAAPDGRLFLVAKDSIGDGRLHLYVRNRQGTWGQKTIVHPDRYAQPTRPVLALDLENQHAYVVYRNSVDDNRVYVSRTGMSRPAFDALCVFLEPPFATRGSPNNVTSTKQNVDGITDLVAAASRQGQIYSGRLDLASGGTPASSESSLQAESTTGITAVVDGTPLAGFEVIWDGRLSLSQVAADDSQWRWLRSLGVNTIVNLDEAMFDVGGQGFDSFLWVRLAAGTPPTEAQAERFLKFIQLRDNQPAHISSATSDRRATMVVLVRYAIDGWTIENALKEGQRLNGGVALSSQQVTWLLGWTASHPPGSHDLVATLAGTTSTLGSTVDSTTSTLDSTVDSTTSTVDSTLSTGGLVP